MSVPPSPGRFWRFNPPPNWPPPPPGWTPPQGWASDPSWPLPPDGWQLWVEAPPAFGTEQGPPNYPYQPPPGPPPPPPPRKSHRTRNIILGIVGAVALIIVIAVATAPKTPSKTTSNNQAAASAPVATTQPSTPAATATTTPAATHTTTQPAVTHTTQAPPATSAPPAAPQYTVSQQQAIAAAENYLQAEPGFSYQGLIDQLDSQYGNGFSVADATFAVNHISVDWNQQAAYAAKNYMTTEPGWSCSSLLQQLDSPYGGKFTQSQAEYGTNSVGLGTC